MNERLKDIRKRSSLTQEDFAKRIGITQSTVTAYECGNRTPSDSVILNICREFGVSENWIRTGEGEMYAAKTRNEILSDYIRDCMHKPDSYKTRFTEGMARLTDEQWEQLAQIVNTIFEQKK